jgi:hypothetical protein
MPGSGVVRNSKAKIEIQQTLQALDGAATDSSLASISGLGIPQVRALKREVAEIFPASNLPAFLLQGLLQLKGRALDDERVGADLRVLFRETRQLGIYGAFIATPALIIHGYQRLLTLAGRDLNSAFPDGTWQFYTEFGLREDAARHCVETTAFAQTARNLSEIDSATCVVYAALHTLFSYEELLVNEWYERVAMRCVDLALADLASERLGRLPRKLKADERAQLLATEIEQLRTTYRLHNLPGQWASRRPYHGPAHSPLNGYVSDRRATFDRFLTERLGAAPDKLSDMVQLRLAARRSNELPAYLNQMSLLRTLRSNGYGEERVPLDFEKLAVALTVGDAYYLIELCERDAEGNLVITPEGSDPDRAGVSLKLRYDDKGALVGPYDAIVRIDGRGRVWLNERRFGRLRCAPLSQVRAQVAAALRDAKTRTLATEGTEDPEKGRNKASAPVTASSKEPGRQKGVSMSAMAQTADLLLAAAPRERQEALRKMLNFSTRGEIEALRNAPIVINWEKHDQRQALAAIRRTRRGCGDQGLAIVRAGQGLLFDMSHIFFDGGWGSALAEILTGFATGVVERLSGRVERTATPVRLELATNNAFINAAREAIATTPAETWAETRSIELNQISALRKRLSSREIELTVNDLLVLARYEHAAHYQPGPAVLAALNDLTASGPEGNRMRAQIDTWYATQREIVPALLVPMDASGVDPRQRLHPATLRNPSPDLLPSLKRCENHLRILLKSSEPAARQAFEAERKTLCGDLLYFGAAMQALREITMRGEGFATAALKLLGHLPRPMQSLLDMIPQKIDVLNEIVKGTEVFSNIGQVAKSSSISRFMSARDDGETKLLIWGIMTDAQGQISPPCRAAPTGWAGATGRTARCRFSGSIRGYRQ